LFVDLVSNIENTCVIFYFNLRFVSLFLVLYIISISAMFSKIKRRNCFINFRPSLHEIFLFLRENGEILCRLHYTFKNPHARQIKKKTSVSDCSACDVELHYIVHPSPCSGRRCRITSSARTRWWYGDRSLMRAQRVWARCTAVTTGLTDVTYDVTFFSASLVAYRENRCNSTSKNCVFSTNIF
jgi:hypothetical protein